MKILVLTDDQAAALENSLKAVQEHMDISTGPMAACVPAVLEQLERQNQEWTKEGYTALPMAPFTLMDQLMDYARGFIMAQNRYNDVKNITAAAIMEFILACMGYKSRGT